MPVDFSQVFRAFDNVSRAAENVEADIKAVAHRRAQAVLSTAKRLVPVKTGKLRDSLGIVEDVEHKQYRVEPADISGRPPLLPVWLEFGTVKTFAQPFLRPAVDENRAGYLAEVEAAIERRIKGAL